MVRWEVRFQLSGFLQSQICRATRGATNGDRLFLTRDRSYRPGWSFSTAKGKGRASCIRGLMQCFTFARQPV